MTLGFLGIGRMGLPIARNLIRGGTPLLVWNRTPGKCGPLVELGARQVVSIDALCQQATVVMLMLLDESALDAALGRGTPAFRTRVRGTTLVQLGTTSPAYSLALEQDIRQGGGHYVEASVSGSRVPAEQGRLVGMVAGHPDHVAIVLPLLKPVCSQVFQCGPVPGALRMKLAVNHYLIAMVTALAETVHAARSAGLDLALLRDILDAGPMASDVSRIKLEKLVTEDHSAQAAVRDVGTIARLIAEQARLAQAHAPIIEDCVKLYRAASEAGHQDLDMTAVVEAFGTGKGRR